MTSTYEMRHERVPSRWELIRDALVFQGKLLVDGFRDMIMVPVSLIAALLDLAGIGSNAGLHFYEAVRVGRRTEEWINLFGAADHTRLVPPREGGEGLDRVVGRLEDLVVEEYARGGMTRTAKESVDRALDRLRRTGQPDGPDRGPMP